MWSVIHDDALTALKTMDDNRFDSIVTDPPYGLREIPVDVFLATLTEWVNGNRTYIPKGRGFMGKSWDEFVPPPAVFDEAFRVLKPGGYLLCFAGTRTVDLMGLSIRLAGFELRDSLDWIYGSGLPKSRDISKAIDSEAGAEREVIGPNKFAKLNGKANKDCYGVASRPDETTPATDESKQWEGWGTALKPAHEPIILARKPLAPKHTVAANVLEYGTGAINVDGCRVASDSKGHFSTTKKSGTVYAQDTWTKEAFSGSGVDKHSEGRWPPNIILTHTEFCLEDTETLPDGGVIGHVWCAPGCPALEMARQSGVIKTGAIKPHLQKQDVNAIRMNKSKYITSTVQADSGPASRFFPIFQYNAKASKKERPEVEGLPGHPTVKPVAVMQWLVRLVTQPGGKVLDPFAGSGTTAEACELEGMDCVLIENDPDSIRRIDKRMEKYEIPEVA